MFGRRSAELTRRLLEALTAVSPGAEIDGLTLEMRSGVSAGRAYPVLLRARRRGWVQARWSAGEAVSTGEGRRLLYRVSEAGAAVARSGRGRVG